MAGGLSLEIPPSLAAVWPVEKAGGVARSRGGGREGRWQPPAPLNGGLSTGTWPQFRTIREKEVTILNSKQCDDFYHRFSKIPSLVRVIKSQMMCVQDTDRKHFCYVSTCPCPPGPGPGREGGGRGGEWGGNEQG